LHAGQHTPAHARHFACSASAICSTAQIHTQTSTQDNPTQHHAPLLQPNQHTHMRPPALSRPFSCRFDARSEISSALSSAASDHAAKLEDLTAMLKEMQANPAATGKHALVYYSCQLTVSSFLHGCVQASPVACQHPACMHAPAQMLSSCADSIRPASGTSSSPATADCMHCFWAHELTALTAAACVLTPC
jgi:hypothetical protein